MATAKEDVQQLLDKLPEDATYEDIQYHLYVRQKIAKGLEDVEKGRVISQEEVEERMSRWLNLSNPYRSADGRCRNSTGSRSES